MIYIIGILSTIAWVWLIVTAVKESQIAWAAIMIIFMPACVLYGILNWSKASIPFILLLVAIGLMFTLSPEQIAQVK